MPSSVRHIGYRLRGQRGPLKLRRVLVGGPEEILMPASLAKLDRGTVRDAPPFEADAADRAYERRFGPAVKAKIPRELMAEFLDFLSRVIDVRLDGRRIEIQKPSSGLRLCVSETKGGEFVARIEQDPSINELFDNGVFRRGRSLHAVGPHGLAPERFEALRKGQVFVGTEVGGLVSQLIPSVRQQLPVTILTPRLPGNLELPPRIQLSTLREGDTLEVVPTIVYGNPPIAKAEGGHLILVGEPGVTEGLPLRNLEREEQLREQLLERFGLEPGTPKTLGATEAIELSQAIDAEQRDVELSGTAHREFVAPIPLEPKLVLGKGGDFELYFVPIEDEPGDPAGPGSKRARRADPAAVVRAWSGGEAFAPLLDGGFGQIPADFMSKHGHLVADLLAAREATAAKKANAKRAMLIDLAELALALDEVPPPEFERLSALVGEFERIPAAVLPSDLKADLRDYQQLGVDWLHFLREVEFGALLADDMGLGKTLQALCTFRQGEDADGNRRQALVVSPTSVLHNWSTEIERFRPALRVCIYHGPGRKLDPDADVVLTTYAILRGDIDSLQHRQWDTAVLDEAQAIKNPASKVARAAYRVRSGFRLALTGTPVENRLEDLWSQFHFLQPGLLGGRSEFSSRYVKPIGLGEEDATNRLRRRIRPFVMRRLKSEVAKELPPRTSVVLRCELSTDERVAYDTIRAAARERIVANLAAGASVMQVLEVLLRLRQAACHPGLLPGGVAGGSSSKVALLLETLEQVIEEGHKALVFSQWTSLLDLVEPQLREHGIACNRLDGSTRDRQSVVDGFQDPAGPPVMLLSLKAGGTGLNLTAADNVFLLDPWWNPAVEDQAADRAHRIGQDKPVIVHRLIATNTVEERILLLQQRKRDLAESAVGDSAGTHGITREELLALLD